MKRIILFVLLAAALRLSGLLPFESHDVAALVPVQALTVSQEQGRVILDGGEAHGVGATFAQALEDLQQSADGTVFLGTAKQIILTDGAVHLLPEVVRTPALRPAAVVVRAQGNAPDPEAASRYLSAHDAGLTIQMVRAAILRSEPVALPVLAETEGGFRLYGASHR